METAAPSAWRPPARSVRDAQHEAVRGRLTDGEAPAGRDVLQPADLPAGAGPRHLDGQRHALGPQAEVQGRRAVGQVAVAEPHLLDLAARCGVDDHAGADGLRVGMPAGEVDREPVVTGLEDVAIDGGRGAQVGDEDVDPAVAVVVRAHDAPALARVIDAELDPALREGAVAVRHEQARAVLQELEHALREVRDIRVRARMPAVGVEEVGMAVVVEVRQAGAPAPAALAHAAGVGRVLERAGPVDVPVETVPRGAVPGALERGEDAGHEPVDIPVVVVVAGGGAHAVLVGQDRLAGLDEGQAAVVAQDLARAEVAGQQQVGVAVRVDVGERRRERVVQRRSRPAGPVDARREEPAHIPIAPLALVAPEVARGSRRRLAAAPVREEQVEVAVAVVVRRRHGVRRLVAAETGDAARRREPPGPVVAEQPHAGALERHEVLPAVAVEVDEVPRPVHVRRRDAAIPGAMDESGAVPGEQPALPAGVVGHVEIEAAVPVDVGEREAGGHVPRRLELFFFRQLPRIGHDPVGEPDRGRDVLEAASSVPRRPGRDAVAAGNAQQGEEEAAPLEHGPQPPLLRDRSKDCRRQRRCPPGAADRRFSNWRPGWFARCPNSLDNWYPSNCCLCCCELRSCNNFSSTGAG